MTQTRWLAVGLAAALSFTVFVVVCNIVGCSGKTTPAPLPAQSCGWTGVAEELNAPGMCGVNDPKLPPEPSLPTDAQVCTTLTSNKSFPDESNPDTNTIQAALNNCKGKAVRLVANGTNTAFVSGSLIINSTTLWVDRGVTLYASRDRDLYQSTGNCGLTGVSDSNACLPLLQVTGTSPGIVGDGIIDGQGGEPVGQGSSFQNLGYSWWDLSNALRASNGSAPNPALLEVKKATSFLMYRITLHNSPKFHVKLNSIPPAADGTDSSGIPICVHPGDGFIVWGVTILTPSVVTTSTGFHPNPYYSRNTDGIDPGEFNLTSCGVIACSTVSTGDDMIALKAAHGLHDIVIAHNHFGTGHGMSLGSETNGNATNIDVYDLTIDGDSRWNGAPLTDTGDFNGIRVKSDESRGGIVDQIHFSNICIRDVLNPIVIDASYNPLYGKANAADAGADSGVTTIPIFKSMDLNNVHGVSCTALAPGLVILQGYSSNYIAGPITLNNVIVDGITQLDVSAQDSIVNLGPGNVNFQPPSNANNSVTVNNQFAGNDPPMPCTFPVLPTPQ